jgi:lysophospholipase L1-like esterase
MQPKKAKSIFVFVIVVFLFSLFNSTSSAQATEALPPLKIVHLGDSYSAGNGARSAAGARNYYSVSGCYRSSTNWGSQFADSLADTFDVTYINRACSGGVVADITNARDIDDTRLKNLDGSCPSSEYPDEEEWRSTSPINCSRFIEPQIEAIDSSVDLVLMTMGGNDLGFATIVKNCFSAFRSPADCREAVDDANSRLGTLEVDLTNAFAAIRAKLRPGAKIAYVSYPQLLQDVPYKLARWAGTPFEDIYDVGTEIRALSLAGEERQRAVVQAANTAAGEDYIVFYDGTKALFEGHEPDPSLTRRNPDRWIHEFEGVQMVEWYHPNALGHENWAAALSAFEAFGATGGTFGTNADVDVAFVVDTTGSMGDDIAQVQADLSNLVDQLAATTDSYRVAVVSYRDFPERTGWSGDYPFRVDQTFTDDSVLIQAAINALTAAGGWDWEETVFSGIQAAIELPWRPGVTKIAIVIGDAPALSPEPISNMTADQIVANSIAIDPVKVIGVDTADLNSNGALGQITDRTGGSVIQGTSGLTTKISEILDSAAKQPFAWVGQAYSGKIGQPILFDGSGSYDPSGSPITLYEWDFDSDGVFDLETGVPTATHIYEAAFNDFMVLRVTGQDGTALASARTVVNAEGFASQGDEDPCGLDENGYSIILDEEGRFIPCTATNLPEGDQEGVTEISVNSPSFIDVPSSYWAFDFIERLYAAGITGGCGVNPLSYCPEDTVTRAQMAVFLERGIHGASYVPPAVGAGTGFGDVPPSYWSASFIKQLVIDGITVGCGSGNYCPEQPVTRAQMAVFLLRSKHGGSYVPPGVGAGTGFGDVPANYWSAAWIKQLVTEGITSGCGGGNYCPEQPVTRAQMAVFLVRTFSLP